MVLALLTRYKVTATFCLIGGNAAANPRLVAMIADAGHEIANHTYTHPIPFGQLSRAQVHDEIHRTADTLAGLTRRRQVYFRAPGGEWNTTVLAEARARRASSSRLVG